MGGWGVVGAGLGGRLCVKKLGVLKKVGSTEWRCDKVNTLNVA
jgi:hypothetical protein